MQIDNHITLFYNSVSDHDGSRDIIPVNEIMLSVLVRYVH